MYTHKNNKIGTLINFFFFWVWGNMLYPPVSSVISKVCLGPCDRNLSKYFTKPYSTTPTARRLQTSWPTRQKLHFLGLLKLQLQLARPMS